METFITEFEKQLRANMALYPHRYKYNQDEVPGFIERYKNLIRSDGYDKNTDTVKATCKALGIKPVTYKAIRQFIDNHK